MQKIVFAGTNARYKRLFSDSTNSKCFCTLIELLAESPNITTVLFRRSKRSDPQRLTPHPARDACYRWHTPTLSASHHTLQGTHATDGTPRLPAPHTTPRKGRMLRMTHPDHQRLTPRQVKKRIENSSELVCLPFLKFL